MKNPLKYEIRQKLVDIGEQYALDQGYKVERVYGMGKGSVRRLTKNGKSLLACIRTTQDGHLGFAPKANGSFGTLEDVDVVISVASDDWDHPNPKNPKNAFVHWFEGDVLRDYFHRAREARTEAGWPPSVGIGMWLAMYRKEDPRYAYSIGQGYGIDYPPARKVPLSLPTAPVEEASVEKNEQAAGPVEERPPLTLTAGTPIKLDLGRVKITIEIAAA